MIAHVVKSLNSSMPSNTTGNSTSLITIDPRKDAMEQHQSHTLFVRNLPADATEIHIRQAFQHCDAIQRISFHKFESEAGEQKTAPPFAMIVFASAKGVTDGSQLSGLS